MLNKWEGQTCTAPHTLYNVETASLNTGNEDTTHEIVPMPACVRPQTTVFKCSAGRSISGVTSPAAGRGYWCSSRSPVGQSHRWTGCTTGFLRSTPCSTPFFCGPANTYERSVSVNIKLTTRPLRSCAHHSVAARQSGQPHPAHVKQPHLSIVVWKSDDLLVGRDAYPEGWDHFESKVLQGGSCILLSYFTLLQLFFILKYTLHSTQQSKVA